MENSRRWVWLLVRRMAAYAIVGGAAMVVVGALLVGAAGAFTGWILVDGSLVDLTTFGAFYGFALSGLAGSMIDAMGIRWMSQGLGLGLGIGLILGSISGGITGTLAFALRGLLDGPSLKWLPSCRLLVSVSIGMVLGVCGTMTSIYIWFAIQSQGDWDHFRGLTGQCAPYLMLGIPTVMMGGGLAGGLWSFKRGNTR